MPEYIVRPLANSQLLEIVVTDNVPVRAQAVANELANQLILKSPGANQTQDQEQQKFVADQISYLQDKINETLADIDQAEKQLAGLNSARQIADTQSQIVTLQSKLTQLQSNYSALLSNTQQGANNSLSIIENAALPANPIGPKKGLTIILSAAIAFMIATGAAFLLEYLDDTLKTPDDITRLLNIPVIGHISEMSQDKDSEIYVAENPRSVITEAFRSIRINLEFVEIDNPIRTLLVTSPAAFEGKTSVATNLAIVMSQGGKRVVLLDTDLRRPNIHRQFHVANRSGLSDMFRGNVKLEDVLQPWKEENLHFITTGSLPPNPVDLLSSKRMDNILEELGNYADIIIIDGPPLLVPEVVALSTKVDGVLIVIKHASTRKNPAKTGLDQLNRVGAHVIGAILNKIPRTNIDYYSRYQNYGYYGTEESPRSNKSIFATISKWINKNGDEIYSEYDSVENDDTIRDGNKLEL